MHVIKIDREVVGVLIEKGVGDQPRDSQFIFGTEFHPTFVGVGVPVIVNDSITSVFVLCSPEFFHHRVKSNNFAIFIYDAFVKKQFLTFHFLLLSMFFCIRIMYS
jgi:hypothetical protein